MNLREQYFKEKYFNEKPRVIQIFLFDEPTNNCVGVLAIEKEDNIKDAEPLARIYINNESNRLYPDYNAHAGKLNNLEYCITLENETYQDFINDGLVGKHSLLHELGHIINGDLEDDVSLEVYHDSRDEAMNNHTVLIEEVMADSFAACFLGRENSSKALKKLGDYQLNISNNESAEEYYNRSKIIANLPDRDLLNVKKMYSESNEIVDDIDNWICSSFYIAIHNKDENKKYSDADLEWISPYIEKYNRYDENACIDINYDEIFGELSIQCNLSTISLIANELHPLIEFGRKTNSEVKIYGLFCSFVDKHYAQTIISANEEGVRTYYYKYY